MSYEQITYEQIGAIARISLNRADKRNAQGQQLLRELDEAMVQAERDPEIRVVILAGQGAHFSAGHDLKEGTVLRANPTVESRYEYENEHFLGYCLRIYDLSKPTIAQVQGACIAAGFMVANMCDMMVASEDAYFSDPTAHTLGAAAVEMLIHPYVLGLRKAKEFLFTGSRLTAAEGLELGMINKVVPTGELEAETLKLAQRVADAPPFALRLLKRSLNRTRDAQGFRSAIEAHFDTHQLSHTSKEYNDIRDMRKQAQAASGKTSFGKPAPTA